MLGDVVQHSKFSHLPGILFWKASVTRTRRNKQTINTVYEICRKLICSRQFVGSMKRESETQGCRWQYEKEKANHTDVWFISCFKNVHNSNTSSFCGRLQLEKLSSEFILSWNLKQCNPQQRDENCGKESVWQQTVNTNACVSQTFHLIKRKCTDTG